MPDDNDSLRHYAYIYTLYIHKIRRLVTPIYMQVHASMII